MPISYANSLACNRVVPGRRQSLLLVFFIGALLIFCCPSLAAPPSHASSIKKIKVVSDDNYPPYIFRNADGRLQGILVDEWRLWETETGINVTLVGMDWGKALQFMADGKADVIDTLFYTKKRAQLYDFSPPYADIEVPIFFSKNIGPITGVEELHGFVVGVKAGDACIDVLKEHGITTLKRYPDYESIVKAAAENRLKVFCIDKPPGLYYLYKMGIENKFRYSVPLYTGHFHRAVRKGRQNLLRIVDSGFADIPPAAYKKIRKKWMGASIPFNPRYLDYIFLIIAISAALGGILLLWNYLLRRKVAQKTEQLKQTLVALQENEKKYRELVENANSIILRLDTSGNITFFNEYARTFFGYENEEILGRNVLDTIVPEIDSSGRNLKEAIGKIFEDPDSYIHNINENIRKNGERVWIAWNNKPVYDADNTLVGMLCIGNDITERRKTEAERERLASAIAQADESVIITDGRGRIQYVNPAFEALTGYTREEAVENTPGILKSDMHDADFYRSLWEAITSGETWKGRFINRKKDGSHYTVDATITPMRDDAGNIVNYIAVQRDVTEALKLEAQLLQARKMESVGRLAGGVAHDFNNMLSVILGYSELALARIDADNPIYKNLKEIHDTARRSADLTRQLLAFSRKQIIAPQVIDINEQVKNMEHLLRRAIGEDIDLVFTLSAELWPVHLDPSQVDQVVVNLAVNARDAMPDGGMLTIETGNVVFDEAYCKENLGFKPGEYAMLAVSDSGCGMDKETLANVFEPFFTTKKEGRGTGIGLATVYGIVKQNNGFINIYSEPENGTTIRIYFPRYSDVRQIASSELHKAVPVLGNETIALVEDQGKVRDMTRTMLEELGYKVLTAAGPEQALRLCEKHEGKIHLLFTDVVMPNMNGRELAGKIRRLRPDIKILYTSGYTANAIAHHGVLETGVHFIQKPFSTEDLSAKIRETLEGE